MPILLNYYDEGWNAYVMGVPFNATATVSWRDGWKDAFECKADYLFPEIPNA